MAFNHMLDKAFEDRPLSEVLDAPTSALQGVSEAGAAKVAEGLGADTVRELATNKFVGYAQAVLHAAGEPPFDPGPFAPWPSAFAEAPLGFYVQHPSGRFRVDYGPVYYRGRTDGTARLLLVGQDPATDELLAHRAFVGFSGQRVQGLLRKMGLSRSYLMLNTFLFGIRGQFDPQAQTISEDPALLTYRNGLFDLAAAHNKLEAIIAIGAGARHAVAHWPGRGSLPLFELVHPSAPATLVLPDWNRDLAAMRAVVSSDPGVSVDPSDIYGADWVDADVVPIPRFDLPFGVPNWMGTGSTRSGRDGDKIILWEAP